MKKIVVSILVLLSFKANTQIVSEEVLEDGTHVIHYVPRHYSKEEIENFRPRIIPTSGILQKYPLITLSNQFMDSLSREFNIAVEQDSTLEIKANELLQRHIDPNYSMRNKRNVTYHQIWELNEPIVNYSRESFTKSIVSMIKNRYLQSSLRKNSSFFCKEFEYNGNYYLLALIE